MTLVLSGDGSIGPLSSDEVNYLNGVTSSVQTQIDSKASINTIGLIQIASNTITSGTPSVTVTNISQAYEDLVLIVRGFFPTAAATLNLRVNNDTTASRYATNTATTLAATTFADSAWVLSGTQSSTSSSSFIKVTIHDYARAGNWRMATSDAITNDVTTATSFLYRRNVHVYNQTGAISTITFYPSTGNFQFGSYTLFGVN